LDETRGKSIVGAAERLQKNGVEMICQCKEFPLDPTHLKRAVIFAGATKS